MLRLKNQSYKISWNHVFKTIYIKLPKNIIQNDDYFDQHFKPIDFILPN